LYFGMDSNSLGGRPNLTNLIELQEMICILMKI